jgi:hypothetical protein
MYSYTVTAGSFYTRDLSNTIEVHLPFIAKNYIISRNSKT